MRSSLKHRERSIRGTDRTADTDVVESENVTADAMWPASDVARYVIGVALPAWAGRGWQGIWCPLEDSNP